MVLWTHTAEINRYFRLKYDRGLSQRDSDKGVKGTFVIYACVGSLKYSCVVSLRIIFLIRNESNTIYTNNIRIKKIITSRYLTI